MKRAISLSILLSLACVFLCGFQGRSEVIVARRRSAVVLPFSFVAQTSNSNNCVGPITCAVTPSPAPATGDLLIVDLFCNDLTAAQNPSLTTDNGSSTWAQAFLNAFDNSKYYEKEDYTLAVAGSPTTFTATCGAATTSMGITIREYHRTAGSWVFGGTVAAAFGTSTTATSGSVTPTGGVPALISGYFLNKGNTNVWTTANSTIRANSSDAFHGEGIGAGEQIVASASGSYTASAGTSVSIGWTAIAAWYK